LVLAPDEVIPARGRQLGFWGGETEADERAKRALARVHALLGPDAVRVPEWRGGRGPNEQLRLVPAQNVELQGRTVLPSAVSRPPWPGQLPLPSPAIVYEHPCDGPDPYYPVPRPENAALYARYRALAEQTARVHFVGRLATYRYYNMDQVVAQALTTYARITGTKAESNGRGKAARLAPATSGA